jgi:HPt (histidine-containing phosphotransfer) domain-containing protein
MIREILLHQLNDCDVRIEKCERDLGQQRQLVRELERDGHRLSEALATLEKREMALSANRAERECIRAMLNM